MCHHAQYIKWGEEGGRGELIPYFAVFVCAAFALSVSLSEPMSFLLFTILIPQSHWWGVTEPW